MSRLLQFLQNRRLSVTQWLGVMAAGAIGLLVLALRIQGGRLHKAQVQLLEVKTDGPVSDADKLRAAALGRYQRELDAYKAAGGTL
jgi:hypothetical protein